MATIITDKKLINQALTRGVECIYPSREILEQALLSGKRLTIFCGYDPNAPTLHIGHGVTIRKLAQFQRLGHRIIFLFGDFTGQIGDPDKLSVRQQITHKQVLANLKHWKKQIQFLIDVKKTEFKFNSHWLAKLNFKDLIGIAQHFTAQQLLDREMFRQRIKEERPIYLHEFFYPLMQAYDSVAMNVDLEIGGNDQTFNMLAGRDLMKSLKGKDKFVLATKLLADPTGKKMGKSEGNMLMLADKPEDMYGKVMSWPDTMIMPAFEVLTDIAEPLLKVIADKLTQNTVNPRDIKMQLAHEIVRIYQGDKAADKAQAHFKNVFQEGNKPVEISEVKVSTSPVGVLELFVTAGLTSSNGEARRLIKEGALRIDEVVVTDEKAQITIPDQGLLLQRGKKQFVRVLK
jgi:tyrosyl-tRNA synthetase